MNFFNKKLLLLSVACLSPLANGEAPYPSTYTAPEHNPTLITNATVLTGDGKRLEGASVYFVNGKIVEVTDSAPEVAANTRVIDGQGRWVTPGVIDVHSHLGVYPSPDVDAHSDGNEATAPVTAEVWAEHSIWPQDPSFGRAATKASRSRSQRVRI